MNFCTIDRVSHVALENLNLTTGNIIRQSPVALDGEINVLTDVI